MSSHKARADAVYMWTSPLGVTPSQMSLTQDAHLEELP